jgi:glycosyltransferase involved in cell wall biosynthesis
MKLVHISPSIGDEASGPSYSVSSLCKELVAQGNELTLASLDLGHVPSSLYFHKTFPLGFGPRRLGRSPEMLAWMQRRCQSGDIAILHNHGMWQMNAVYPAWVAATRGILLIQSPRGAFTEWAMKWGSRFKPVFWHLLQRPAMIRTDCFHATAEAEFLDIRRLGFTQPVAVVPNGIDIPNITPKRTRAKRTILFLGRLHVNKGLDILLPAWKCLQDLYPEWHLRIVGKDDTNDAPDGYRAECLRMARDLGLSRVDFSGALYGDAKLRAYREADIFVLPSYSENFAMTVAESLSVGTPVVVSKGAPWSQLSENGAGWWIDIGVEPLVDCLKHAMAIRPEELAEMGERGREWMRRDFSWERVGTMMSSTYRWLRDRTLPVPGWVRLD